MFQRLIISKNFFSKKDLFIGSAWVPQRCTVGFLYLIPIIMPCKNVLSFVQILPG